MSAMRVKVDQDVLCEFCGKTRGEIKMNSNCDNGKSYKTPNLWEQGVLYAVCRMLEMSSDTVKAEDVITQAGLKNLNVTHLETIDKIQLEKLKSVTDTFLGL